MIRVVLAVPDLGIEPLLVKDAGAAGMRVVRRCVDAADMFAAASADPVPIILVSAGLPRLQRDTLERIGSARVVGLADGEAAAERLRAIGVERLVRVGPDVSSTLADLRAVLSRDDDRAPGVWATGVWNAESAAPEPEQPARTRRGMVIAVWGPAGAPGRTTTALGVSEALADDGRTVGLVDADTYAPAVALALGLVDHASGLAVVCRHADSGSLSPTTIRSASHRVADRWFVLGGIGRPDRWADIRAAALDAAWDACRATFDVTVIDMGFCLESDDAGAWSSRRNAAALSALAAADHVLAVADATELGAARLVTAWPAMTQCAPAAPVTIVQNRARKGMRGWSSALGELGVTAPVAPVPWDPKTAHRCWVSARSLKEAGRRSPLRRALGAVAHEAVSR